MDNLRFMARKEKMKGPLKIAYKNLQDEKEDLYTFLRNRYRMIRYLENNPHIPDRENKLKNHYSMFRMFHKELTKVEEEEKIISCA